MNKTVLYDLNGKKKSEIELPKIFGSKIREDLVLKYLEAGRLIQPYSPAYNAGRKHSASGTISHKRHDWKGHYGKGISRIPRKTMWRRGTQFYWIGAEISSTRGGRRAHGPKGIGKEKKINKKEMVHAMNSGFASTANINYLIERYDRIDKIDLKFPLVVESNFNMIKTKDFIKMIKNILGEHFDLALKNKNIRAGKGKLRGRKYKTNAGVLIVKGFEEKIKIKGVEIKNVFDVLIDDLYPLGRLTIYTEKALEDLGK
jgi:large subunit ribosomal protein L4e